ncbi:MAG: HAMP domain-containing histidine kinase [Syntrophorhabdaceae bacterium]|nr:HAMP domain-containing histidine kinase [Syntrophorhabdaceae bacterium]
MGDRKAVLISAVIFVIFIALTAITGYLQIKMIVKNIEGQLENEGELVFNHLKREIDINLEYLNLLEEVPTVITPKFLSIMVYDDAIIDELYSYLKEIKDLRKEEIPLSNFIIVDEKGEVQAKRGEVSIDGSQITSFLTKKEGTFIRLPSKKNLLTIGVKLNGSTIFFSIDDRELASLRKRLTIKEIIDNEGRRLNVMGINLYDERGAPYLPLIARPPKDAHTLKKRLNSKYLPDFTIEIFLSKRFALDLTKRMAVNFVFILAGLSLSGSICTYIIFFLVRRHERKLREFEKEFETKERLVSLGRLASGMAHEIKNPLNAIGISIQRLKREFVPGDGKENEYLQFIDIIRGEISRIDRIVEEFLLSTKAHLPFTVENVGEILEEVRLVLSEKASEKGLSIKNNTERQVMVLCQRDRIKQVFYNIILNGIEVMDTPGGVIDISYAVKDGEVHIAIKDLGPGIKREDIPRIFEYYYTTKHKGMGLGLPISYMIVKDHGGDIRVHSEEGKGSTFIITLPIKKI